FARGRQLCAGNFMFAGHLIEARDTILWDIKAPSLAYDEALHGFTWLDDLAAVGDLHARKKAQIWLAEWIQRFGEGNGAGWTPDLTGRRLIRWINHALFLLNNMPDGDPEQYFSSMGQQVMFLSKRWKAAAHGLPRFEALTGLIYAGLALSGMDHLVKPAVDALSQECTSQIDEQGGIPTRNPEELLEVFTLLTWAAAALTEAGKLASAEHIAAIERIAPTLRSLRHSDGGLARFHGGGRGIEGRLDHALAASGIRAKTRKGLSMGYARLQAGRTSVVVDATSPPEGEFSANAHASTFALELTSGRRPLIVNCGCGAGFGEDWQRAGRATPSHSTLGLVGYSSARLGTSGFVGGQKRELLTQGPKDVLLEPNTGLETLHFHGGHDGYRNSHGLTHVRELNLGEDGRTLIGEDTLAAITDQDKQKFDLAMDQVQLQGIEFQVRFHLHPEVDATLDMGGTAVSLAQRSGEIWVFRQNGSTGISLEPSVYLEKDRIKPRATKQIVLSGRIMGYAARISWTLAKAQDTPTAVRDLQTDAPGLET
ncbi:MAG: heparinase II/III family protein, partial [Halocynthiibacter sp.]